MENNTRSLMNHTKLSVKDPKASLAFYGLLGFSLLKKVEIPDYNLELYFVGYDYSKHPRHGHGYTDREGILELSFTYGEGKEDSTNADLSQLNHPCVSDICISVDSLPAASQRMLDAGCHFTKRLNEGRSPNIAYAVDPDGYRIALIAQDESKKGSERDEFTDPETYRLAYTMLRVKNKAKSIAFYQDVLGMAVHHISPNPKHGFDLVLMGFGDVEGKINRGKGENYLATREGVLNLTWNYGSEDSGGEIFHESKPDLLRCGHIGISVGEVERFCRDLETQKNVRWVKRLDEGEWRIAFLLDPDGYLVEIIQNEGTARTV